jgi:hypothetical protein
VDDFFQRFMQIYYRFPKRDKPSDQEILEFFSYIVSIYEEYDLNNQIISHSQDLDLHEEYSVTSYPK